MTPILVVTRREIREMLSDWRVVLPVAILTFLLPLLLARATVFLVDYFVDDPGFGSLVIPFMLLLTGFIPASFSIVTALEAFVGERERNTLESLFSMPVADRDLYISKYSAALLTPLLASYGSMLICTSFIFVSRPLQYTNAMSGLQLIQMFLLVGLLATTMVSAAVVISSHISTIRAANLMSSFILLPAAVIVQMVGLIILNSAWPLLWWVIGGLALLLVILLRVGMQTFNRESILARENQPSPWSQLLARIEQRIQNRRRERRAARQQIDTTVDAVELHPVTQLHIMHTIIRRELYEVLSDWRMLLPVFLLAFVLPVGLLSGVNFAIEFIGGAGEVARVVPFAILVVGFIPASFALITALESFVGERERSTLEVLLALPISDRTLYLSKLTAALIVPLLTSYAAITAFSGGLALFYPNIYYAHMKPEYLLTLFVGLTIIAILMVAGAVIISSHTGSIRAANLLASFILIPVTTLLTLQFPLFIAERWDLVQITLLGLAVVAVALIHAGLKIFNREDILSREQDPLNLRQLWADFRRCFNEYQPAGLSFNTYAAKPFSARRFYRYEFWALLRELRLPLVLTFLVTLSGIGLGVYLFGTGQIDARYGFGTAEVLELVNSPRPAGPHLVFAVMMQNLRVSIFSSVVSLFSLGVAALMVPTIVTSQISFVATALAASGGSWALLGDNSPLQFLLTVMIHGSIEIPTFILSAALGLRLGAAVLAPPGEFSVGQNIIWALANLAKCWLLIIMPLVVMAALIEGLITPVVAYRLYAG